MDDLGVPLFQETFMLGLYKEISIDMVLYIDR